MMKLFATLVIALLLSISIVFVVDLYDKDNEGFLDAPVGSGKPYPRPIRTLNTTQPCDYCNQVGSWVYIYSNSKDKIRICNECEVKAQRRLYNSVLNVETPIDTLQSNDFI